MTFDGILRSPVFSTNHFPLWEVRITKRTSLSSSQALRGDIFKAEGQIPNSTCSDRLDATGDLENAARAPEWAEAESLVIAVVSFVR